MAIDSQHPLYQDLKPDYTQMYDTLKGERQVKSKRQEYLPATAGMVNDGLANATDTGMKNYEAYLKRAVYHDILPDAIEGLLGMMHRQEAKIKLPKAMEPLLKRATSEGETLQQLLMKINKAQLEYGRIGLLAEVPDGKGPEALPFVVSYSAVRVINWDNGDVGQGEKRLEMVVLDESEFERGGSLEWNTERRFRMLAMSDVVGYVEKDDQSKGTGDGAFYVAAVILDKVAGDIPDASLFKAPSLAGKKFDQIPFEFINTKDNVADPTAPPLLGLSNLCLAIYRGEADYRQALFQTAQETLVIIGSVEFDNEGQQVKVGAGALLNVPLGGDAKYVGVSGEGLGEMRQALEADKAAAVQRGARLLTAKGGDRQSGEALRVRVAAQTATLTTMARAAAAGLESILKQIAKLKGLSEDEVEVKPNLDFTEDTLTGRDLLETMQAKMLGAPLSLQSLHEAMRERGMTKFGFDEEMGLIEDEGPLLITDTRGAEDGGSGGGLGGANNAEE